MSSRPKPPVPANWVRGANLTAYATNDYSEAGTDEALTALKARGATDVAIVDTWYMKDATDSTIAPSPAKSPSDAGVLYALRTAQALGFKVTLKPHVDVLDGTFRGAIKPADRGAWFDSYSDFIAATADMAQRVGAARFVVGSELTSMVQDADAFRAVIKVARDAYQGDVTYAANWVQEAEDVKFWDALDEIGIDAYMPLTKENQPSTDALVGDWKQWTDRMGKLHEKTGKRILFTELGYPSRSGAPAEPAKEDASDSPDPSIQARLYTAAFRALAPLDYFEGISWWDWPADGKSTAGSYSPRGKLAEGVLAKYWARPDLAPPAGATGAGGATGATTP